MKVVPHPQGSVEWLAARCGLVTASRIADVMAEGKGGKPSATRARYMGELIAETLTGQPAEGFQSADMQRGTELEPAARREYEARTGRIVTEVGLVLHPELRAGASPDGLVDADGLVEIKCPRTHTHIDYLLAGKPPADYVPQMAWQCACTGRAWVDFVSFDPRMPERLSLFVVRYTPPAEYLRELTEGVRAFVAEMDARIERLSKVAA